MDPTTAKILTAVVLFIITMLFSFMPYFLLLRGSSSIVSSRRRDSIIAYLNCFAGGVFLGTLLLHIITEGSEEFDEYKKFAGWDLDFPLFNLFVACGFFLVAFVELFVHAQLHHNQPQTYVACDESHATVHGSVGEVVHPTEHESHHNDMTSSHRKYGAVDNVTCVMPSEKSSDSETATLLNKSTANGNYHSDDHHGSVGHHDHDHSRHAAGIRAFLLLMALSFHTIFDGLAVGLQESQSEVWAVFGAVTVHKSVIAFCLGLELFQSNQQKPWKAGLWLFVFGLMSPLGIGIGIGLTSGTINTGAKLLSSSILQGLAGGTFLYVTFLEILCMHIGHHSTGNFLYVVSALIGFGIMAGVKGLDKD